MNKKVLNRLFSAIASLSLLVNSISAPLSVYAQEITPEPTPVVEETLTPTPEVTPTSTEEIIPTPTPEITPTPTEELIPTPTEELVATPPAEPQTESQPSQENNQPSVAEPSPTVTPQVEEEKGELSAVILDNVNASSIDEFDFEYQTEGSATLITDKLDYAPTDTVLITGTGFTPNETYDLLITSETGNFRFSDRVSSDESGNLFYSYQLDGTYRPDYRVEIKDGDRVVASTTFTDSNYNFEYGDSEGEIAPNGSNNWTNGNISGYVNSDTVRFRVSIESPTHSGTYNGHLFIGFTSKTSCRFFAYEDPTNIAIDFNTATNSIDSGSGVTVHLDGLAQSGDDAIADFHLTSTEHKHIRLNYTLHFASGASGCGTGSSQYVRIDHKTGSIDWNGNKHLPIPASAVTAPVSTGTITIVKDANPDSAQDFAFTTTGSGLSSFSLDDDMNGTLPNTKTFSSVAAGIYTVSESVASGWNLSSITCADPTQNSSSGLPTAPTATINLAVGETVTCTFTNTLANPQISVVKAGPELVMSGQPATFTYTVTNPGNVPLTNIIVSDNKCSPVNYVSGDSGNDGILGLGEVWIYTCSYTPGWAFPNALINTATASGYASQTVQATSNFSLYPFTLRKDVVLYWEGTSIQYSDTRLFSVQAKKNDQNVGSPFTIGESSPRNLWLSAGDWQFCEVNLPTGYNSAYGCINYTIGQGYPDWTHVNVIRFDLGIDKTAPAEASEGETIIYNYTLTNSGPASVTPVINDDRCSPLVRSGGDTDGDGLIDPGEVWTYTCNYVIPAGTAGTTITNTVTVHDAEGDQRPHDYWWLGGDTNPANNSDSAQVRVRPAVTIRAYKIVCDSEADLPNWSGGTPGAQKPGKPGGAVSANTASAYVAAHPACHLEAGWDFQWGFQDKASAAGVDKLMGSHIGVADGTPSTCPAGGANCGTNTFTGTHYNDWKDFTSSTGAGTPAEIAIYNLEGAPGIWVRENLKANYVPFTYPPQSQIENNVSAEIYCDGDKLNYDNYDRVISPAYGSTYYCVAFNALNYGNISGAKWGDADGDGIWDGEETGLQGWTIELKDEDVVIDTKPTGANGGYLFENVIAGNYQVCEVENPDYKRTEPAGPSNCKNVTVNPGQTTSGINFGNQFIILGLNITKSNDKASANAGDTVKYTLTVNNTGNQDVAVTVTDSLPGGFEYVPDSTKLDGASFDNPIIAGATLSWNIANVPHEGSVVLTYEVKLASDLIPGTYKNLATCNGRFTYPYRMIFAAFLPDGIDGEDGDGEVIPDGIGVDCDNVADSSVTIGQILSLGGKLMPVVLGAATELPATGSSSDVLAFAFIIGALGIVSKIRAGKTGEKKHAKN